MSETNNFNSYPRVAEVTRLRDYNEDIRQRLIAYRDANRLTLKQLAKQLDTNETACSKYLGGKPEGDVAKFEARALDLLKNAERFKRADIDLFPTPISKAVASVIDTARKTNDICLVSGDAGIGKSCGLKIYLRDNPTAILITASAMVRNGRDLFKAIWSAIDTGQWNATVTKPQFLVDRLQGSNRPLLVDNAHRLKLGGLELLFDLHDETGIPICLVGNPEVLITIRRSDQMFSRIGLHKRLNDYGEEEDTDSTGRKTRRKIAPRLAEELIQKIAPGFSDCADMATTVIEHKGHARALRKQLSLAEEVANKEDFKKRFPDATNRHAFQAAHAHLIRDYSL